MSAAPDDRYPPIGDYGLVGDLRSAALISKQGSVDWLCLPRFDSPWVFGRLLDWDRGGCFVIAPTGEATSFRQYRKDSNVLETTWSIERRRMRVVDFMPIAVRGIRGNPPESLRLARVIQPVRGALDWRVTFRPRFDYGRQVPAIRELRPGMLEATAGDAHIFLQYPADAVAQIADDQVVIDGRVMPGRPAAVLLYAPQDNRRPLSADFMDVHRWLHQTDEYWRAWMRSCAYSGLYEEQVRRSALALKLMQYLPSGAFVAAPTSSLPESIGGSLNWDYRYTWLRDTAVLVESLHELGFQQEAGDFMKWLNAVHQRHPVNFQMMYRIDGDDKLPEFTIDDLEGYRGSRPVRIGNGAVEQVQLDVYGEIMQTAYTIWRRGRQLPRPRRATLIAIVDYVLAHWRDEDSGIWEARRRKRRYLYSQALLWSALDRALRMSASLRMGERRIRAARRARDELKKEVLTRGFNAEIGAFTQALDHSDLDAGALAVPLVGMVPANDPRVISTIAVLARRLTNRGFLYRYVPEESEFHQPEGVFIICTCWMVDVLAHMGRRREAEELFTRVTEAANDLGLFAEEFDPEQRIMLGNFPQALTHLAVIGAVLNLEGRTVGRGTRPRTRAGQPSN